MPKLENLDYSAGRHFQFPTNITVPVSIADKDKFLNLSKILFHFHGDNRYDFESYLSAKCPNLGNPIHVTTYVNEDYIEFGTQCTKSCTDSQHNDFEVYAESDDDWSKG